MMRLGQSQFSDELHKLFEGIFYAEIIQDVFFQDHDHILSRFRKRLLIYKMKIGDYAIDINKLEVIL